MSQLPIDPDADRSRRAWLACPNCDHGLGCDECQSNRNCGAHWHYLLQNEGTRVVLQCSTCGHLWTTDTAKTDRRATTGHGVVATIPVGDRAYEIAVSPKGDRVYVTTADSVKVISRFHHIVGSVPISTEPKHMTLSADGTHLYVICDEGPLTVIDTASYTARVIAAEPSTAEAVSPDGGHIYSIHDTMFGDDHHSWVSVIEADGTTVDIVPVHTYATALALSPDGRRLYVASAKRSSYQPDDRGRLSVIDTDTNAVTEILALHATPDTITVSADDSRLYISHYHSNAISVMNLATYDVTSVDLEDTPRDVTVSPDGSRLYVTNLQSLVVIDTATNTAESFCLGDLPRRVHISGDGERAYALDFAHQTVWGLDTANRSVITAVDVGGRPQAMALSADGQFVYVTDYWAGTVAVISLASVTRCRNES